MKKRDRIKEREYYLKNREKLIEYQKKWNKDNEENRYYHHLPLKKIKVSCIICGGEQEINKTDKRWDIHSIPCTKNFLCETCLLKDTGCRNIREYITQEQQKKKEEQVNPVFIDTAAMLVRDVEDYISDNVHNYDVF